MSYNDYCDAKEKRRNAERDRESTQHVYVMEVNFDGGEYGYTSVHTTYEGALAALEAKVDDFDMRDAYELSEGKHYDNVAGTVFAGDYYGDESAEDYPLSYGIHYMEVQTP